MSRSIGTFSARDFRRHRNATPGQGKHDPFSGHPGHQPLGDQLTPKRATRSDPIVQQIGLHALLLKQRWLALVRVDLSNPLIDFLLGTEPVIDFQPA